jgi:hypothetical protein
LPIAISCVGCDAAARTFALFVKDDWEKHVSESHRAYIEATFEEWANAAESKLAELLPIMTEMSVGPIRTIADSECDEEELNTTANTFLMGSYRRFSLP